MSDDRVEIGLRDVYEAVNTLGGQLNAYMRAQDPKIAVIEHRLTEVEGDIKGLRDTNHEEERHRHEERRHREVVRWTAISGAFVGVLGFIGGLIAVFH